MVKFEPEGVATTMARIEVEERQAGVIRSPYEDREPDYEYMPRKDVSVFETIERRRK